MITLYYSRARERALQTIHQPRAGMWLVSRAPSARELDGLAADFQLDRDKLEDAVDIYEAPRIEAEDGNIYIYVRYCRPEGQDIATEPLLIIHSTEYVATVVRTQAGILDRLTGDQLEYVTTQKTKLVLHILEEVNRSYEAQVNKVGKQILRFRGQMRQSRLSTREFLNIIELEEDLNEFLSALQPQALVLRSLLSGKYLRLFEEDRDMIEDIERSTSELIEQLRGRLRTLGSMREAYDAIATTALNNTFKRLTSIAIFLTIPTIIGGFWGMNMQLPFMHWRYAFGGILGLIIVLEAGAIWYFQRKDWL